MDVYYSECLGSPDRRTMSREASVPAQLQQGPDVLCRDPFDEEDPHASRSRFSNSFSSALPCEASSSCPVSSSSSSLSSDNRRSSSKKRKEFFEEEPHHAPPSDVSPEGSNDFPPEDEGSRPAAEARLDSGAMVYDASYSHRNKNGAHRRIASPHAEGITRKASNKPQMEKRRRKRINDSVEELRKNIMEFFSLDPSRHDKLEKADILEMTVRFIQHMKTKWAIIDRNEVNGENKPIRLEAKKLSNDLSSTLIGVGGRGDKPDRVDISGLCDLKLINTINEQPLTFIIQTAPPQQILQPLQNVVREQCLVGFHANSLGAQPTVLPNPSNQPPVIQLNITNNITSPPDLYQTSPHLPSPAEKRYGSPISPDTTTRDICQDPSYRECPIGYQEIPNTLYDDKPQYEDFANSNIKLVYQDPKQLILTSCLPQRQSPYFATTKETLTPKNVTPRRPIAPKPSKIIDDCIKVKSVLPQINQVIPEPQEPVWRPWDASRKILKPHMVH